MATKVKYVSKAKPVKKVVSPKTKPKKRKGRKTGPKKPWKFTKDTVHKLEQAFSYGATVEEACFYADIARQTYYDWTAKEPELSDKFERLRERPVLEARKKVVDDIAKNVETAKWYLERKKKGEFAQLTELGGSVEVNSIAGLFGAVDNRVNHHGKPRTGKSST